MFPFIVTWVVASGGKSVRPYLTDFGLRPKTCFDSWDGSRCGICYFWEEVKVSCVICPHLLERHVSDKRYYNCLSLCSKKTHGPNAAESSAAELSQGTAGPLLLRNMRENKYLWSLTTDILASFVATGKANEYTDKAEWYSPMWPSVKDFFPQLGNSGHLLADKQRRTGQLCSGKSLLVEIRKVRNK